VVHEHSLFVTNLVNGIDQYTIPTMECIKTFPYAIIQNYPLQVAIVKETEWIVSGGDDGFAQIYDLRTGKFLQRLDHGGCKSSKCLFSIYLLTTYIVGDLVQTVTISTISYFHSCIQTTASL
jgi:WD40 repeat protein